MGLIFAENCRRFCAICPNLCNRWFEAVLVFAVGFSGCNNTCFTFTSNSSTGTINVNASDPQAACTKATGVVRLVLQRVSLCSSCSESSRFQHVIVTIRGIDVNESSTAGDDSPDWQGLAPQLAKQPLQVDLVRSAADQDTREQLGEIAALPAGTYAQVRIRFVTNPPATDEVTADRDLRENICRNVGLNCVVMADGTVTPLLFDAPSPTLHIAPESKRGEGALEPTRGSLFVFPDAESILVLEIKPVWTWSPATNRRDFGPHPVLTANAWLEPLALDEGPSR